MSDVPTREELFDEADALYHSDFPEGPYKIHPTSAAHQRWRDAWVACRDWVLDGVVNRLYWDRYPDAPVKIDPDNPDHNPYVNAWLEIRDALLQNQPLPPYDDEGPRALDVDEGRIRDQIYESYAELYVEFQLFDFPRHELEQIPVQGLEDVLAALHAGILENGMFRSEPTTISDQYENSVTTHSYAYIENDGTVRAGLVWEGSGPAFEGW